MCNTGAEEVCLLSSGRDAKYYIYRDDRMGNLQGISGICKTIPTRGPEYRKANFLEIMWVTCFKRGDWEVVFSMFSCPGPATVIIPGA